MRTVGQRSLTPRAVLLPDGREYEYIRGAEQGGPFWSTEASLSLSDARGHAVLQDHIVALGGACDEWYIDDGLLICKPHVLDPWLRALDLELSRIGATRGTGEITKSTARMICPPETAQAYVGWDTVNVRVTCRIDAVNSPIVAFWAMLGSENDIEAEATTLCNKVTHAPTRVQRHRTFFGAWLSCEMRASGIRGYGRYRRTTAVPSKMLSLPRLYEFALELAGQ